MATKPKIRKAKISNAEKQKEQSARFIKAARQFGIDESGNEFEKAMRKITPHLSPKAARKAQS